jgi:hypothetical protein
MEELMLRVFSKASHVREPIPHADQNDFDYARLLDEYWVGVGDDCGERGRTMRAFTGKGQVKGT